ncbi:hypothetical protein [Streptomyces sp. NPDC056308]|uniref:hypothetical protein n=1 Tax=unclassified Streptomyces TaxID=2593676 RepID=UPI0035D68093
MGDDWALPSAGTRADRVHRLRDIVLEAIDRPAALVDDNGSEFRILRCRMPRKLSGFGAGRPSAFTAAFPSSDADMNRLSPTRCPWTSPARRRASPRPDRTPP